MNEAFAIIDDIPPERCAYDAACEIRDLMAKRELDYKQTAILNIALQTLEEISNAHE